MRSTRARSLGPESTDDASGGVGSPPPRALKRPRGGSAGRDADRLVVQDEAIDTSRGPLVEVPPGPLIPTQAPPLSAAEETVVDTLHLPQFTSCVDVTIPLPEQERIDIIPLVSSASTQGPAAVSAAVAVQTQMPAADIVLPLSMPSPPPRPPSAVSVQRSSDVSSPQPLLLSMASISPAGHGTPRQLVKPTSTPSPSSRPSPVVASSSKPNPNAGSVKNTKTASSVATRVTAAPDVGTRRGETPTAKAAAMDKKPAPLRKAPDAELPRYKCQRDYLLEEMQWMSLDFRQERRWKIGVSKACAYACADSIMRGALGVWPSQGWAAERHRSISPRSGERLGEERGPLDGLGSSAAQRSSAKRIADIFVKGWYGGMSSANGVDTPTGDAPTLATTRPLVSVVGATSTGLAPTPSIGAGEQYCQSVRTALKRILEDYDLVAKLVEGKITTDETFDELKRQLNTMLSTPLSCRDTLSRIQRLMRVGLGATVRSEYRPHGLDVGLFVLKLWEAEAIPSSIGHRFKYYAVYTPRRYIMRWKNDLLLFRNLLANFSPSGRSINAEMDFEISQAFESLRRILGPLTSHGGMDYTRLYVFPAELLFDSAYVIPCPVRGDLSKPCSIRWDGILLDARDSSAFFCANATRCEDATVASSFEVLGHFNRAFEIGDNANCRKCVMLPQDYSGINIEEYTVPAAFNTGLDFATQLPDATFITSGLLYESKISGAPMPAGSNDGADTEGRYTLDPESRLSSTTESVNTLTRSTSGDDIAGNIEAPTKTRSTRMKSRRLSSGDIGATSSPCVAKSSTDVSAINLEFIDTVDVALCDWMLQQFSSMSSAVLESACTHGLHTSVLTVKYATQSDVEFRKYATVVRDALWSAGLSTAICRGTDISGLAETMMILHRLCLHSDLVVFGDNQDSYSADKLEHPSVSNSIELMTSPEIAPDSIHTTSTSIAAPVTVLISSCSDNEPNRPILASETGPPPDNQRSVFHGKFSDRNENEFSRGRHVFRYFPGHPSFTLDGWNSTHVRSGMSRILTNRSCKLSALQDIIVDAQSQNNGRIVIIVENIAESHCVRDFVSSALGIRPYIAVESSSLTCSSDFFDYNNEINSMTQSSERNSNNGDAFRVRSRINEVIYSDLLIIEDAIYQFNKTVDSKQTSILIVSKAVVDMFRADKKVWGMPAAPNLHPYRVNLTVVLSWDWVGGFCVNHLDCIFDTVESKCAQIIIVACRNTIEDALVHKAEMDLQTAPLVELVGMPVSTVFFGDLNHNACYDLNEDPIVMFCRNLIRDELFVPLVHKMITHINTGNNETANGLALKLRWSESVAHKVLSANSLFGFFQTLAFRRVMSVPVVFRPIATRTVEAQSLIGNMKSSLSSTSMIFSPLWISAILTSDFRVLDTSITSRRNVSQHKKTDLDRADKDREHIVGNASGEPQSIHKELVHWWEFFLCHFEGSDWCPPVNSAVSMAIAHNITSIDANGELNEASTVKFGPKFKIYFTTVFNHYIKAVSYFEQSSYSNFEANAMISAVPYGRSRDGVNTDLRISTCLKPSWLIEFLSLLSNHFLDHRFFDDRVGPRTETKSFPKISKGLSTYLDTANTVNRILCNYESSSYGRKVVKGPGMGRGRASTSFLNRAYIPSHNGRSHLVDPLLKMLHLGGHGIALGPDESGTLTTLRQQRRKILRQTGLGVGGYVSNIVKSMADGLTARNTDFLCDAPPLSSLFEMFPINNSSFLGLNSKSAWLCNSKSLESIGPKSVTAVDTFYRMRNELSSKGIQVDLQFFSHPLQSAVGVLSSQFKCADYDMITGSNYYAGPQYQKRPDKGDGTDSRFALNRNIDDIYNLSDLMYDESWLRHSRSSNALSVTVRAGTSITTTGTSNRLSDLLYGESKDGSHILLTDDKKDGRKNSTKTESRKKHAAASITNAPVGSNWNSVGYSDADSHFPTSDGAIDSSVPFSAAVFDNPSHIFGTPIGLDPIPRLVAVAARLGARSSVSHRVKRPYEERPHIFQKKGVLAVKGICGHPYFFSPSYFVYCDDYAEQDMRREPWNENEAQTILGLVGEFGENWWLLESAINNRSSISTVKPSLKKNAVGGSSDSSIIRARSARQIQQYFEKIGGSKLVGVKRPRDFGTDFECLTSRENSNILQSVNHLLHKTIGVAAPSCGITTMGTTSIPTDVNDMLLDELPLFSDTPTASSGDAYAILSDIRSGITSSVDIIPSNLKPHVQILMGSASKTVAATTSAIEKLVAESADEVSRKKSRTEVLEVKQKSDVDGHNSSLLLDTTSSSGLLGGTADIGVLSNDDSFKIVGAHCSHEAAIREAYATALLGPLRVLLKNSSSNLTISSDDVSLVMPATTGNYLQGVFPHQLPSSSVHQGPSIQSDSNSANHLNPMSIHTSSSPYFQSDHSGAVDGEPTSPSNFANINSAAGSGRRVSVNIGSPGSIDAISKRNINVPGSNSGLFGGLPGLKSLLTLSQQQSGGSTSAWVPPSSDSNSLSGVSTPIAAQAAISNQALLDALGKCTDNGVLGQGNNSAK